MKAGQYVITSTTGDSHWHETNAKTLAGAKRAATAMYEESFDGKIEVGYCRDEFSVDYVAVKQHGKWTDAI